MGSSLPRSDVSVGGLAGALTAILMLVLNGGTTAAALAPLLTLVAIFLIEYVWAGQKEVAGAIGGAIVVVGVGIYNFATSGSVIDEAAFNAAATLLLTVVITAVLPRIQPRA